VVISEVIFMAKIVHIFRAPKKRLPMEELEEARAITNVGLEGCAHARPGGGPRQVLLVDRETLEAMDLRPGIVRENITTEGMDVNSLAPQQELRIGEVRLQVSEICHPCDQLEKIRPGLRREMRGRRGMLCRVLEGGMIRRGDAIEKLAPAATLPFAEDSRSGLFAK
jgi:MOSC domain-containing protein YiiM